MAVDERARRMLHDRLEEVLGVGQGDVLMAHLPPSGWSDLATRRDIDELAASTRRDIDELSTVTRHELTALEQRLSHRLDRMDDRFAQQTAEITAAFRGEITTAMTLQIRQTVFAIVGVLLAVAALMAALLGLG